MAIKRIDPNATFKVVSVFDEAIEHETDEELEQLKKDSKNTRFQNYMESLDLSDLKFKEGMQPTFFVVRCLLSRELAEINQKYQVVDTVNKRIDYKNRNEMMLDMFERGVKGVEENGKFQEITIDEVGYAVATDIGSLVSILTTLGKNLKKA